MPSSPTRWPNTNGRSPRPTLGWWSEVDSGIPVGTTGERAIFALLAAFAALVVIVVAGAELAAAFGGHHLVLSESIVATALVHLPRHLGDPRAAWGRVNRAALPGPLVYWVAQGIVGCSCHRAGRVVAKMTSSRHRAGAHNRVRLGVHTDARLATRRDIAPLVVRARWRGG